MSRRKGTAMLEMQVAAAVLGIALAGLLPLLVMQSRLQRRMEARFDPARTYHLLPSADLWARKLGAAAQLSLDPPVPVPPPVLVIDNGAAGYSEVGSGWVGETRADAYGGTDRYHGGGTGANNAAFTFTGLQPGWYSLRVTWPHSLLRAKFAQFTAWDGATKRGRFLVKQNAAPSGDTYGGRPWEVLGTVALAGSTLRVELPDQIDPELVGTVIQGLGKVSLIPALEQVVADGVRLVPVRNAVTVNSLSRTLTGESASARFSVAVVTP